MVLVLGNNEYLLTKLDETTNLLVLGRKYYAWTKNVAGQDVLTRIKRPLKVGPRIAKGNYWLFNVVSDDRFTPGVHLSLVSDKCQWQPFIADGNFALKTGESVTLEKTTEQIARPRKNELQAQVIRSNAY